MNECPKNCKEVKYNENFGAINLDRLSESELL